MRTLLGVLLICLLSVLALCAEDYYKVRPLAYTHNSTTMLIITSSLESPKVPLSEN